MPYTLFTVTSANDSPLTEQLSQGSFYTGFEDANGDAIAFNLDVCAEKVGVENTIFAVITETPDEVRKVLNYLLDASEAAFEFCDFDEYEPVSTYAEAEDEAAAEFCDFA